MIMVVLGSVVAQVCQVPQRAGFKSLKVLTTSNQAADAVESIDQESVIKPKACNFSYGGDSYKISNLQTYIRYDGGYQTGRVVDALMINVTQGSLLIDVKFEFDVSHVGYDLQGRGYAEANLDDFWFVKQTVINDGDFEFKLGGFRNLTENFKFNVAKLVPDSTTTQVVLELILNSDDMCSIRKDITTQLEEELARRINNYLQLQISVKYLLDYAYTDSARATHHVTVNSLVSTFSLSQKGLSWTSDMEVHSYNGTDCGTVPLLPLSQAQFGGFQTVYSLMTAKSLLKFALEKNFFPLKVSKEQWFSPYFQFSVGDLARVIPALAEEDHGLFASGSCRWNSSAMAPDGLGVFRYNDSSIQVLVPFSCELAVQNKTVLKGQLASSWLVRVVPDDSYIDFRVNEVHFIAKYERVGNYEVVDKGLADFFLNSLFDNMRGQRAFGSGFPVDPRRRASVMVLEDSFIIYDKTAA